MYSQQPTGQRRTQNICDRNRRHEQRAGPGAIFMPEPMCQVDDNAGEKTCFGEAQKKTGDVKLHRRMNHGDQYGDESPGNQDAGNPFPRAPALHDERSRNLKQEITGKKMPAPKPNTRSVKSRLWDISRPAKPTLTRSRYAMK